MPHTRLQIQSLGYSTRSKGGPTPVVASKKSKKRLQHIEATEKKSNEMEMLMNAKEELNSSNSDLQKKLTKEEVEKLAAIDTLMTEKDARMTAERSQASLTEDLEKALRKSCIIQY